MLVSITAGVTFYALEATVGCVAADCKSAHKKHRSFNSNLTHHFNGYRPTVEALCLGHRLAELDSLVSDHFYSSRKQRAVLFLKR